MMKKRWNSFPLPAWQTSSDHNSTITAHLDKTSPSFSLFSSFPTLLCECVLRQKGGLNCGIVRMARLWIPIRDRQRLLITFIPARRQSQDQRAMCTYTLVHRHDHHHQWKKKKAINDPEAWQSIGSYLLVSPRLKSPFGFCQMDLWPASETQVSTKKAKSINIFWLINARPD